MLVDGKAIQGTKHDYTWPNPIIIKFGFGFDVPYNPIPLLSTVVLLTVLSRSASRAFEEELPDLRPVSEDLFFPVAWVLMIPRFYGGFGL